MSTRWRLCWLNLRNLYLKQVGTPLAQHLTPRSATYTSSCQKSLQMLTQKNTASNILNKINLPFNPNQKDHRSILTM